MTTPQLIQRIAELQEENLALLRAKNHDYAGNGDAFANLRACEAFGIPAQIGFIVRMSDKLSRLSNLIQNNPKVVSESAFDTASDLAGYAMLYRVFLEEKYGKPQRGKK